MYKSLFSLHKFNQVLDTPQGISPNYSVFQVCEISHPRWVCIAL